MKLKFWFSALTLAVALASSPPPAEAAVVLTLAKDGGHTAWVEGPKGVILAGPTKVEGVKATLDTGAAKNDGNWLAVVESAASGNVAVVKIPAGDAPRVTLKPDDFDRIGRVTVAVTDKDGKAPTYAAITLTDGAGNKHAVALRPGDAGQAVFHNVATGDGSIRVQQKEPENQQTVTVRLPLAREEPVLALTADVALPDGMETQESAAPAGERAAGSADEARPQGGRGIISRLAGFLIALVILGGVGYLVVRMLRGQGVTAQSALARAGIQLPEDETPGVTTVAEEAPGMVDPNLCPFCGGPKAAGGPCPNCELGSRGPAGVTFAPASGGGKRLVAVAGPRAGQIFTLSTRLTIGRETGRDVAVPEDPSLSRHHASVDPSGVETTLTDEGSSNGSWVNGQRVQRHALRPGDEITLGASRFRYEE